MQVFATTQLQALYLIRGKILSGELVGGTKINVADIAAELNCSRIPVREALRQLEAEGFVTMIPNRGASVALLTPEAVKDLFDIRTSLELMALEDAVEHFDAESLHELSVLKDRMDRNSGTRLLWIEHHDKFHQFIAERSGRERLSKEIERIHGAVRPYILMYIAAAEDVEVEGADHQQIMDVLKKGDKREAIKVMRAHLSGIVARIVEFLRKRGEVEDKSNTQETRRVATA